MGVFSACRCKLRLSDRRVCGSISQMDDQRAFDIIEAQAERRTPIPTLSRRVEGFNRADVVMAFQRAFLQIGGVQRLAIWANANPDKFFPLYARMAPSTSLQIGDNAQIQIVHALPPTPLDQHPTSQAQENT
jgi:hypothetical protein